MAFSQSVMAQSSPSNAPGKAGAGDDIPVSKHQLKPTATQILQHNLEAQGKQIEQVAALIETQTKQTEAQTKQIEELTKRAELQTKQIETLNADVNRLTAVLLAHNGEPAAASPIPTATPQAYAGVTVVTTGSASPSLTAVKAEPVPAESVPTTALDGSPTHVIKRGENLISVARQHGTSVAELLKLNKIEDERKLQIGQTLLLPKPTPQKTENQ